MPSLHCRLPEEEEDQVPERDEVVDLGEEVQEAQAETEEQETDEQPVIIDLSPDYDLNDDRDVIRSDTSSEHSSMLNDPTIQMWVPEVSSSDESEGGGFWTPPSSMGDDLEPAHTMGDDFEQAHASTSVQPLRGSRNMARRSRGLVRGANAGRSTVRPGPLRGENTARRSRRVIPGQVYARRGRHRQPLAEQEFYRLTPFEQGLTFNGFAQNLEPETITGHELEIFSNDFLYRVRWRNIQGARLIEGSVMREHNPAMVAQYWESRNRMRS